MNEKVIFASVATLSRKHYLDQYHPEAFDLVIVDEFHHAAAVSYQKIINHFRPEFLLGITATPDRNDGKDVFAGLHVLVFDYRYFGDSDGEPRQHFNIRAQLDDWAAAIACARKLDGVDAKRIALWGSSFSGGHVITAAVEDGHVQAVSSQGPMMDGFAALTNVVRYAGALQALRVTAHALWDTLLIPSGRRHLIPLVAEPGELGVMTSADAQSGYTAIVPPDWRNEITAGWLLELPLYRPIAKAHRLPCPTLICICTQDSVAPASAAEKTAAAAGDRAEIRRYDIGHFDIYVGDGFERAVSDQTEFFGRVLRAPAD